jgi:hypothetical protein
LLQSGEKTIKILSDFTDSASHRANCQKKDLLDGRVDPRKWQKWKRKSKFKWCFKIVYTFLTNNIFLLYRQRERRLDELNIIRIMFKSMSFHFNRYFLNIQRNTCVRNFFFVNQTFDNFQVMLLIDVQLKRILKRMIEGGCNQCSSSAWNNYLERCCDSSQTKTSRMEQISNWDRYQQIWMMIIYFVLIVFSVACFNWNYLFCGTFNLIATARLLEPSKLTN